MQIGHTAILTLSKMLRIPAPIKAPVREGAGISFFRAKALQENLLLDDRLNLC